MAAWFTRLEPAPRRNGDKPRADDPRLGEIIETWNGVSAALRPGRAVLVGFPVDDGVRRNGGRTGAAAAPNEIRGWLARLTPWNGKTNADLSICPPLDAGNVREQPSLEKAQTALGEVVAGVLERQAVPIVLGGGHETAFGHYLGYVARCLPIGIINLDAHLDVRPRDDDRGHSGSPFRQAMEHPTHPLGLGRYVCLGAQPQSVSRAHLLHARERQSVVRWCDEVRGSLCRHFVIERDRLAAACDVYLSIDADVVRAADVPGVSAPNPLGLDGVEVAACARLAGESPTVRGFDLVEINPRYDLDGRSARWAATMVWNFLMGLAGRPLRDS